MDYGKGNIKLFITSLFDEWEFYDLSRDPGEEENLYRQNIHQDLIEKYKELLNQSAKLAKSQVYKRFFRSLEKKTEKPGTEKSLMFFGCRSRKSVLFLEKPQAILHP